jgi:hypothetical protein
MSASGSDISGITIPKTIETRFGVELEMCVKADALCIAAGDPEVDIIRISFKEKFELFYKSIIRESRSFEYVKNKYKYIGIQTDSGYYIYDMNKPIKTDENPKRATSELEISYFSDYTIPFLMEDFTIVCGDSGSNSERVKASLPLDSKSISFECITPILSFTGETTREKINTVLRPLLELFGLEKPGCIIMNYSMGFHVNTSLYDKTADKYFKIGTQPFLGKLLKNYITKEREIYSTVRKMRPINIKSTNNYSAFWAQPLYKNFNKKKREESTKSNNNIRHNMTNISYISRRQRAIKHKRDYLLEFRLFESSSDIETLISDTEIAIKLIQDTYKQMKKDGIEIPLDEEYYGGGKKYRKTQKKSHKKFERKYRHTKRR